MPVPSSYNDITEERWLRDFIGWVWYEKQFYVPSSWTVTQKRVVLRFESVFYRCKVVSVLFYLEPFYYTFNICGLQIHNTHFFQTALTTHL